MALTARPSSPVQVAGARAPSPAAPRRLASLFWRWLPALLAAATLVTRLPFMTRTLYAFDSANFALAIRDGYNVAFHRPHPPGYPLYVGIGWVLNLVVHDPNRALILEGIVCSAVGVAAATLLARALYGRAAGLLTGLLLLAMVGFWGYGEVAYTYVCLGAEMAVLALLAYRVIGGHRSDVVWLGLAWAVSLGIRWDGALFCLPLWVWALWLAPWRPRLASVAVALVVVVAFAVPMVQLSGGPAAYLTAVNEYLHVWSPQSAFVISAAGFGGTTEATYNFHFFIDYGRQMLGVGLILLVYLVGRRFGPATLGSDLRSRFLLVWIVPPILEDVFGHLGEPGYLLGLAPQAALVAALGMLDLGSEMAALGRILRARGWRLLPSPVVLRAATVGALALAVLGWNVQAFAHGVGPGRLPDLRAHDATTAAQVAFIQQQSPATTLVLAHDVIRQLDYYVPSYPHVLLYSEYVPDFQTARDQTPLPPGVTQVVVLDSPLLVPPEDASRVREQVLVQQPLVTVWIVDVAGASAIEHGYEYLHVVP